MSHFLYSIDVEVFRFLNQAIANPVTDKFFTYITILNHWVIAYVILIGILWFKGGRLGKLSVLGILLTILVSDQLSSHLLKNLFERVRPCNALENVRILVPCLGSYSMPSSHAVNNFAAAAFFGGLYPKYKTVLYSTATLIALSRPIVGVHYPSDILVGAVIGWIVGFLFFKLTLEIYERYLNENKSRITKET